MRDQESCAIPGCKTPSEDIHGFCTDHADEMFDQFLLHAEDVLGIANKVYFGRTHFPEQRLLQHFVDAQRDHLLIMHWTANWPESKEFEEALISAFKEQSKFRRVENEALGSEGTYSGAWNALYISFALKYDSPWPPGAINVEHLHWRNRIWPDPVVPNTPVLLRCELTEDEARKKLDRFKDAADTARPRKGRVPKQSARKVHKGKVSP